MDKQGDFFRYGPQFIRPLILKDVAEIVGVHETTISRITTSKYIDTDYGVIPIKMLFSTAVSKTEGQDDGLSKNAVKDMVREIIEEHTGEKALSDQKISDLLAEKGIKLARRTVAKYRKELDIDSSFIRG
jgi:DNA-directed RNA polymerase specialized sigma subunit, sigma54 homolog